MKDEADQSPITDIHMLESNPDHKPNHHHHRTDRDHHEHHRTTRTLPPVPVLVPGAFMLIMIVWCSLLLCTSMVNSPHCAHKTCPHVCTNIFYVHESFVLLH